MTTRGGPSVANASSKAARASSLVIAIAIAMFGRITPSSRGRRGRIVVLMSVLMSKMETRRGPSHSLLTRTCVRSTIEHMFASPYLRRRASALAVLVCLVALGLLALPGSSSGARPARQHVVLPGETLWGIAGAAYGGDTRFPRPGDRARQSSAQRADRAGPAAGAAMSALQRAARRRRGGQRRPGRGGSSRSTSSTRSRTARARYDGDVAGFIGRALPIVDGGAAADAGLGQRAPPRAAACARRRRRGHGRPGRPARRRLTGARAPGTGRQSPRLAPGGPGRRLPGHRGLDADGSACACGDADPARRRSHPARLRRGHPAAAAALADRARRPRRRALQPLPRRSRPRASRGCSRPTTCAAASRVSSSTGRRAVRPAHDLRADHRAGSASRCTRASSATARRCSATATG